MSCRSVFRVLLLALSGVLAAGGSIAYSGEAQADEPIRTFLVAGQSNGDGYGLGYGNLSYGYLDPPDDLHDIGRSDLVAPLATVKIFRGDYYSGIGSWNSLEPGFGITWNGVRFGPELSFGHALHAKFGSEIRLIKYTLGGTNLAYQWDPASSSTNQYDYFIDTVQNAVTAAGAAGETLDIVGMIWMQGESDALDWTMANDYQQNLTDFIAALRNDLALPDLNFYIGSIADSWVWTYRQTVWNAQDAVAAADPRVAVANGRDLPLFLNDGDGSGYIHYTTSGLVTLGERFGAAVLSSLVVDPDPLVAGQNGLFSLSAGIPNTNAYLVYSLAGPGSTWIPQMNIALDLASPHLRGVQMTDAQGNADWSLPIPPAAAGISMWLQVVQYEYLSNMVAATIQ